MICSPSEKREEVSEKVAQGSLKGVPRAEGGVLLTGD